MKPTLLLIDDEPGILRAAARILEHEGYEVHQAATGDAGLSLAEERAIDLAFTDLRLPDIDGLEVLRRLRLIRPETEVVVITGHGTVERAVQAMREGAYDFIEKPLRKESLLRAAARALEKRNLIRENEDLRGELERIQGTDPLVGQSATLQQIKQLVRQVAATSAPVLIQGESGTGKELIADMVHRLSDRAERPHVKINCSAIPETLLESELFGHERGAFTGAMATKPGKFELADGGTLFLDEIAEMSPPLQAKLLRVLQDNRFQRVGGTRDIQVDVRIISATNANIDDAIANGRFRRDLFFRLNVISIAVPPLRERRTDIPILANYFLGKYRLKFNKPVHGISDEAMQLLHRYAWPGNVRELENVLQRAVAVATKPILDSACFLGLGEGAGSGGSAVMSGTIVVAVGTPMPEAERRLMLATLAQCGGDRKRAAGLLRVSSRTIYRRLAALRDTEEADEPQDAIASPERRKPGARPRRKQ